MPNNLYSLDRDIFKIQYAEIQNKLLEHNIHHYAFLQRPHLDILINKDLKLEGDSNFWGPINTLYTTGCFSYSFSNFGYGVKLGRYCSIARGCTIMGSHHFTDWISTSPVFYRKDYHDLNPADLTDQKRRKRRIHIGHDVWLGANVTLKSDIKIGNGAIIASNAVVTKDVPAFSIVGGNPARLIRMRFDDAIIEKIQQLEWWRFHKDDLAGLMANEPHTFLEQLQERIENQKIQPYTPKILTLKDLIL